MMTMIKMMKRAMVKMRDGETVEDKKDKKNHIMSIIQNKVFINAF